MLGMFLKVRPAIYAVHVSEECRSNVNDISILSESEIIMNTAEDTVACILPLKAITIGQCSEKMPLYLSFFHLRRTCHQVIWFLKKWIPRSLRTQRRTWLRIQVADVDE